MTDVKQEVEIADAWVNMYIINHMPQIEHTPFGPVLVGVEISEDMETQIRERLDLLMTKIANVNTSYPNKELSTQTTVDGSNVLDVVGQLIDGKSHVYAILSNDDYGYGATCVSLNQVPKRQFNRINNKIETDAFAFEDDSEVMFRVNEYSIVNWMSHFVNNYAIKEFKISKYRSGLDVEVVEKEGSPVVWDGAFYGTLSGPQFASDAILNHFSYSYLAEILTTDCIVRDPEFHSLLQLFVAAYDFDRRSIRPCGVQKFGKTWNSVSRYSKPSLVSTEVQWVSRAELIRTIPHWCTQLTNREITIRPDGNVWGLLIKDLH